MSDNIIFSKSMQDTLTRQEPVWLSDQRRVSWDIFMALPWPTTQDEGWRRTDLRKIKWDKFNFGLPILNKQSKIKNPKSKIQNRLVIANNQVVQYQIDPTLAARGVIFCDLSTAIAQYPDLVQPYLSNDLSISLRKSERKFAALNSALWQNGVFLYLPQGVEIETPFQTTFVLQGEGQMMIPRTLIVAERSAKVNYIEESVSQGAHGQALNVGAVEIYANENSQIRYVDVQQWGDDVYNFNIKRAVGQNDSKMIWETGQFGGQLTKTYYDTLLPGNGAGVTFNGVYLMQGKQHLDMDCLLHHTGLATNGDVLLHGAVKDKSRMVFTGLIKIAPAAQQTNSYLKNENMMLDHTARVDTLPSLEIDANDVRASHGATVGKIDEEHIFYLMSRGIPRKIAIRMIVDGFFHKVFDRMYYEQVRKWLFKAVSEKL